MEFYTVKIIVTTRQKCRNVYDVQLNEKCKIQNATYTMIATT